MNQNTPKYLSTVIGTAFAVSLAGAGVAHASQNPFQVTEVAPASIQVAEAECGANKQPAEAECGANKAAKKTEAAEANCGANKKEAEKKKVIREASCGEAKCGSDKK
ncbi:MAG TPA: hypothetical protein VKA64_05250 [Gammaproteobacteria bacterium]|nr:hypothetical protein [Gammaproteobacteria bacterium]